MRSATAAIALAGVTLALASCGGDSGEAGAPGESAAIPVPINLASCEDWNNATTDQRFGTIEDLGNFSGRGVDATGGTGAVLDPDDAYELFERQCEPEFADSFRLYKLYGRAAAFAPQ